jgi:hypothetical protein
MILLLLLACGDRFGADRFDGDRALRRTLAAIDRDRDGTVRTDELPDSTPDLDGDGVLSTAELRQALDVDPWTVHAEELDAPVLPGPMARPRRALTRDLDHAPQTVVRDVLRFLRRELEGDGRTVPDNALILQAASTGRLDSVPAKEAMVILRDAAVANGTPLPAPKEPPAPCCATKPGATTPGR